MEVKNAMRVIGVFVAVAAVFLTVFLFVFVATDWKEASTESASSDLTSAYGAAGTAGAEMTEDSQSWRTTPPSAARSTRSS